MNNNAPPWAQKIIREVADEYKLWPYPKVNWRRSKTRSHITGTAWWASGRISITVGQDWDFKRAHFDQKLTLLHELAHLIAGRDEHHSPEFYRIAFTLYRKYKLPIAKCKENEYRYKPRNAKAGYRLSRPSRTRNGTPDSQSLARAD